MRAWLAGAAVAASLSACSGPGPAAGGQATFEQLRARPLQTPRLSAAATCPVSHPTKVRLPAASVLANGVSPFYFGPWGPSYYAGDFNKTPWFVERRYGGRLLVRGSRLGSSDRVAFGFWPAGYGTPAARPDVPVAFTRPDQEGRLLVYQAELDVEAPAGGREDAHFWSFPAPGCYAIQADGDGFSHVTVISVM